MSPERIYFPENPVICIAIVEGDPPHIRGIFDDNCPGIIVT